MFLRALVLIGVASAFDFTLLGCICVALDVKYNLSVSAAVFRGMVTEVRQLPLRKEMRGRKRDTATFTVSEYWKGSPAKTVVAHLVEPRSDCIGADFNLGQEYLVFAVAQRAKDYRLGNDYFWYGWLDILHEGDRILTVNRVCDSTAEIKDASAALRELGKGKRTH